jgi:hypothetical protein
MPKTASVDDLIQLIAQSQDVNGAMASGYVLAIEFFDADGLYWITTLTDDQKPVWQHKAILNEALDYLAETQTDELDEGEEDDE